MSEFNQVLIMCMRHTHKSRCTKVRKTLPPLEEATKILKGFIKEGMGTQGLILEASNLSGYGLIKFETKMNYWMEAWKEGRWCKSCGQAPVGKNNRFFCTPCHSATANKVQSYCGAGNRVCHTGGTRRII